MSYGDTWKTGRYFFVYLFSIPLISEGDGFFRSPPELRIAFQQ